MGETVSMPPNLPALPSGIYRHYKGKCYQVFGYGHDANADEFHSDKSRADAFSADPLFPDGRIVVMYIGLELDGANTGPRPAVRTMEDFHRLVCWNDECDRWGEAPDGTEHRLGYCSLCTMPLQPRFKFVGEQWPPYDESCERFHHGQPCIPGQNHPVVNNA